MGPSPPPRSFRLRSRSPEETELFGTRLAEWLETGDLLLVSGELGSGKTCLLRSVIRSLGYTGKVRSPSFTIVALYDTPRPVIHVDLFRIESSDLPELGIGEFIDSRHYIVLVEWAEKLGHVEAWTANVLMGYESADTRMISLAVGNSVSDRRIVTLERTLKGLLAGAS